LSDGYNHSMQCCILRFFWIYRQSSERTILAETNWQELFWFDPENRPSDSDYMPLIVADANKAMEDVAEQFEKNLSPPKA
jgi:hypothetical protein